MNFQVGFGFERQSPTVIFVSIKAKIIEGQEEEQKKHMAECFLLLTKSATDIGAKIMPLPKENLPKAPKGEIIFFNWFQFGNAEVADRFETKMNEHISKF